MMNIQTFLLLITATLLSGCALLQPGSNDDRLNKVAGRAFVLSVPDPDVDLSQLPVIGSNDETLMRLIQPEDARQAYLSNGNRAPGRVDLADPSASILNALAKYYVREHDLKFIARGTIRNLDPAFIQRALTRGDYVLDVRLTRLELRRNDAGQFYPLANYQLTVVDRQRGRNLLQDHCSFAQPENAQTMQYFTVGGGQNLEVFLKRFASPCLQYFAKGTPLPSTNQVVERRVDTQGSAPQSHFSRVAAFTGSRYYPDDTADANWLNTTGVSLTRVQALSPTLAYELGAGAVAAAQNQWTTFNEQTFFGAELTTGINYFPEGDTDKGYHLQLRGQLLQTRQNAVTLSTNAIGLSAGAFYPLFWQFHVSADYGYWQHLGPTTDSNLTGHEVRIGLRYQYR